MSWIRVLLWLLPRHLRSSWVLLAVSSFGILAAVTLMATGAGYSDALAEGGLHHVLASKSAPAHNTQMIVQQRRLGPADYANLKARVEAIAETRLGSMLRDTQRFGRAQPNIPFVRTPMAPPPGSPMGRPVFLTELEAHSRIVDGRWPRSFSAPVDGDLELEVVLGTQVASFAQLEVGSRIYLMPFAFDPSERIVVTVVGLAEPIDPREEYWMNGSPAYFTAQEIGGRVVVPLYMSEESFFGELGSRYPALAGDFGWLLFLDTSVLSAGNAKQAEEDIVGLERDINKAIPQTLVLSGLDKTLEKYRKDLTHARVPIFLFISLVVLVILYFLAVTMGLLARTRNEEYGLFRSRGASVLQMGGLLALGEGTVVLISVILGPFLALAIVRYGLLKTVNPAGDAVLSVGLSTDMFVMGAVGGLLSLAILVASGLSTSRLGMVEYLRQRARPPTLPFLQRYYIDLLVLGGIGLIWWQISERGGFFERDVFSGALEGDLSIRLGPLLVLLGAALLVLRFLPYLVRLLAWVGSLLAPAWVNFALVRVARDPLPHGSLAVILMMVAALGVFGATFQSTLSRSQRDQALYEVGGDMVIKVPSFAPLTGEELARLPGVESVSPIGREGVTLLDGSAGGSATLLTVDPETLADTAWFRDDFASKGLDELLEPLRHRGSAPAPVVLPEDASTVGIWVNLGEGGRIQGTHSTNLWVRVSDADGRYRSLLLGDLRQVGRDSSGGSGAVWAYLEVPLPLEGDALYRPPFKVSSIFISGGSPTRLQEGVIGLDDITVKLQGSGTSAEATIVEGFEGSRPWVPLPSAGRLADRAERTANAARTGRYGLSFSWESGAAGSQPGVIVPSGPLPLPAIGSSTFRAGQVLLVKSGRRTVPLLIRETAERFPTLSPSSDFLLVSLEDYVRYNAITPAGAPKRPREFWISPEVGADRAESILAVERRLPACASLQDREAAASLEGRNPLAGGGWNGLTILGISALTIAMTLALSTYAVVSVRSGRIDLTVIRALGLSRLQVLMSLAVERVVIAALGIAAGSVLGLWLGRWVLGLLDITASGKSVVPPMTVKVEEWLIAVVAVELAVALALAVVLASLAVGRLRVSDTLRAG